MKVCFLCLLEHRDSADWAVIDYTSGATLTPIHRFVGEDGYKSALSWNPLGCFLHLYFSSALWDAN